MSSFAEPTPAEPPPAGLSSAGLTPADGAADLAAATPADRDRFADALRVGSLLVVILGHWLMVAVTPEGRIDNALKVIPALQPVTWVLQVMPLFFLVGGVAHAHTLDSAARRDGPGPGRYAAFVRARAARLLRPSGVFLGVWIVAGLIADRAGWTRGEQGALVSSALVMVPQLLWFVGIYLGAAAFAPLMYRLHRRFGLPVVVALIVAVAVVDVARFRFDQGLVGNLNFALVWLALHQLGFAWRDGSLTPGVASGLAVLGAGGLALALTLGPYPVSMVGLPGDAVSNMAPPTFALLCQGLALVGIVGLARPWASAVLLRPRAWYAVAACGRFAMTAFLWHLTALMLVILAVRGAHLDLPAVGTATWWWTRPLWFAVLAVPTAALVAIFVRFDAARRDRREVVERRRWVDGVAAVGAAVIFVGILMVSIAGVDVLGGRPQFFLVGDVTPAQGLLVLVAGSVILLLAEPRRATPAARAGGVSLPADR